MPIKNLRIPLSFLLFTLCLFGTSYAKSTLNIQTWKTTKEIPVYFVQSPQIPMVDILVAFNAGSSRDGIQPGLANLTANMIGEGTPTLTADQIATQFDNLGAIETSSTTRDMTVVSLRSLNKPAILNSAISLFLDTLTKAKFSDTSFARVKANTLQGIALQQQNPSYLANVAFYNKVFANTPYATPINGNINSIAAITSIDVSTFYKQYYVAQNAIITIVGAINATEAKKIAIQISDALMNGKAAKTLPMIAKNQSNTVQIHFPVNQTTLLLGEVGVAYNNPDEFPLLVGNYILGGGSTSQLFSIVREKYGLTYGIGSYFVPYANNGPFAISLQTKNNQVNTALQITKSVVSDYLEIGPTPQQLQAAKDYLIGNFPLRIACNANIANFVLAMAFYHLPLNYLDTYREKINSVTIEQVKTAMNKYIDLNRFVTISVGGHAEA